MRALGARHGFAVAATEDPAAFTDRRLRRYVAVVVFLSTTGDVLDGAQQAAFEALHPPRRRLRRACTRRPTRSTAGAGTAGCSARASCSTRPCSPRRSASSTAATRRRARLPRRWQRTDEWYDFRAQPRRGVRVLALLDESTYAGGSMGARHPIAWCRRFDGGRSWYTALGHTAESYAEPRFRAHLLGGIRWAAGG